MPDILILRQHIKESCRASSFHTPTIKAGGRRA